MTTPFSSYLSEILARRGQAATLSAQSGVPTSYISKLCKGGVLPSPDVLSKLIDHISEADKAVLVREYLLLHLPKNAPMVKVIVNDEEGPRDRLQRAIDQLDPTTRESLALLIEAVLRAPEQGTKALQAVGMWFQTGQTEAAADTGAPAPGKVIPMRGGNPSAPGKGQRVAEEGAAFGGPSAPGVAVEEEISTRRMGAGLPPEQPSGPKPKALEERDLAGMIRGYDSQELARRSGLPESVIYGMQGGRCERQDLVMLLGYLRREDEVALEEYLRRNP